MVQTRALAGSGRHETGSGREVRNVDRDMRGHQVLCVCRLRVFVRSVMCIIVIPLLAGPWLVSSLLTCDSASSPGSCPFSWNSSIDMCGYASNGFSASAGLSDCGCSESRDLSRDAAEAAEATDANSNRPNTNKNKRGDITTTGTRD